jgi:hypothetical protein
LTKPYNFIKLLIEKEKNMKKTLLVVIPFILLTAGCNLLRATTPSPTPESPDAVYTHAAETMSAELTRVALLTSPTVGIPTTTFTFTPSNTSIYTATKTPIPCLFVGYSDATIDVTVPDYTVMSPGQAFTKTWRLTNAGTCTWNSSYQLVFDHGDGMGVPNGYSQTLTAGTVAPGQTVDVSVNLVAPMASGTYTGYWRFRDPNGVYFGLGGSGTWIVKIVVANVVTVTLAPVVGESGTIRADGGPWPDYTAGESNADITKSVQTYLSYNIAGIPAGSTITEAKFDFTAYSTTGTPFNLGPLNAYVADYGAVLDMADFVPGFPPGNIADWGSTAALNVIEASNELKAAIQSKLGTSRIILRLQFAGSNMDAVKDRITFTNPSLIVTYTTP